MKKVTVDLKSESPPPLDTTLTGLLVEDLVDENIGF